ncbi:MAG: glutaredoxin family protein [Pseudomonadota bacterium]|nr:glutaredoxin family protein [Pseudomonadota bacterium]MEC8699585.1 glutaredoxin family protein [Pseudomonadota bacterium]MED5575637.1 glutaredoxin family protein [Pseudomonadota bacterium]
MNEREVIVYTTPFCVPCEQLKHYLDSQGVPFTTRDLMMDEDAQDKIDDAGIRSTPILEVDGELYAGEALAPEKIRALLDL